MKWKTLIWGKFVHLVPLIKQTILLNTLTYEENSFLSQLLLYYSHIFPWPLAFTCSAIILFLSSPFCQIVFPPGYVGCTCSYFFRKSKSWGKVNGKSDKQNNINVLQYSLSGRRSENSNLQGKKFCNTCRKSYISCNTFRSANHQYNISSSLGQHINGPSLIFES